MIAGLEFLKSWRFWVVLTASTFFINLGTAGAYIAAVFYFPPMYDGSPDDIYHGLTGFLLMILFVIAAPVMVGRDGHGRPYPEAHQIRLMLAVGFTVAVVIGLEAYAIRWFLLDPILDGAASSNITPVFGILFGISGGRWIAEAEWAAMTGANGDGERGT